MQFLQQSYYGKSITRQKGLMAVIAVILFSFIDIEASGQSHTVPLIENEHHMIYYQCNGSTATIIIDAISDTSNNINQSWPKNDMYWLSIDVNNNGKLDSQIDKMLSPFGDKICDTYLVDILRIKYETEIFSNKVEDQVTTPCNFDTNATGDVLFKGTKNSNKEHVFYQLTLPPGIFSEEETIGIIVRILDGESGYTTYPEHEYIFSSTLKVSCEKN